VSGLALECGSQVRLDALEPAQRFGLFLCAALTGHNRRYSRPSSPASPRPSRQRAASCLPPPGVSRVVDGRQRHPGRGADLASAQALAQGQPDNLTDLAHSDTGLRIGAVSPRTAVAGRLSQARASGQRLGLLTAVSGPSTYACGIRGGDHRSVFVVEQVRVRLPLATAAVRLANLTRGGGLAGASHHAYRDGTDARLRVGPVGDVPGLAKLVRIRFLDPVWSERGMTVGLRWEAAGGTTAPFPVLDADLALSPSTQRTCTLACSAVYRPPLGRLGAALDQAVMNRLATATIRNLLQRLAAEMVNPSPEPNPEAAGELAPQHLIAPQDRG
jgi:hypothetical protein